MVMLPQKPTPPKGAMADLTTLVYGRPKIGKSTWCSNADAAVFFATEPGLNSLNVFQVPIESWKEFLLACKELIDGGHGFKTVIVDTIDNAYKMCADEVNAKAGILHESDAGFGKGFTMVNNEFQRVISKLARSPYGVIMISHSKDIEVETRTGKITRTVPGLSDSIRRIITGMADLILYCDVEAVKEPDGSISYQRVMRTKPTTSYDAGDRTGRLPDTMPLDYPAFLKAIEGDKAEKPKDTKGGK